MSPDEENKGFITGIENFNIHKIQLEDDYEGSVEASLIEYKESHPEGIPVLYIHGYSDYFFHPHMAKAFYDHGFNFYALDLRKYGNSILKHQHPNYCKDFKEYFTEIDFALNRITDKHKQKAILMGHSNGGLISTLYTKTGIHKDLIQLLILNAPFFVLNLKPILRVCVKPLMKFLAGISTYGKINNVVSHLYTQSLDKKRHGEWEINNRWKPRNGFPGYFHYLASVIRAQKAVLKEANISIPTLFLISSDSFIPSKWEERIMKSDIIINSKDNAEAAKKIGQDTEIIMIDSAIHDVFLSSKKVRELAFRETFLWIKRKLNKLSDK